MPKPEKVSKPRPEESGGRWLLIGPHAVREGDIAAVTSTATEVGVVLGSGVTLSVLPKEGETVVDRFTEVFRLVAGDGEGS